MLRNIKITAAVAAALACGDTLAQPPTPAQAQNPLVGLYIAGSSSVASALINVLEIDLCGGYYFYYDNGSTVSGTNFYTGSYSYFSSLGEPGFFAVSCTPAASTGVSDANGSNVFTIWYRTVGDSAVGALPLVSGASINQLYLANATSVATGAHVVQYTATVSPEMGASSVLNDSFAGDVFKAPVNFGITDVEPGALIGNNFPSAYATSVYGNATAAQLAGLGATTLFDQVFGIFVNTKGLNLSDTPLSLSAETIANVLRGSPGSTDWHSVPDSSGKPVTTTNQPIVIINREQGAGARAATDIFFTTDECNKLSVKPIKESTGGTADSFSTGNALAAANSTPGSITYATIDNAGSTQYPNLTLVNVNGVVPSQLNAAAGIYSDWFEATAVTGPFSVTTDQQSLINYLIYALQTQRGLYSPTAQLAEQEDSSGYAGVIPVPQPLLLQILANPIYNTPALPISSTNDGRTYINAFTRAGSSCDTPIDSL